MDSAAPEQPPPKNTGPVCFVLVQKSKYTLRASSASHYSEWHQPEERHIHTFMSCSLSTQLGFYIFMQRLRMFTPCNTYSQKLTHYITVRTSYAPRCTCPMHASPLYNAHIHTTILITNHTAFICQRVIQCTHQLCRYYCVLLWLMIYYAAN